MKVPTIGIIGKTTLTKKETHLLTTLGRVIARAGKILHLVPAAGTAEVVEKGVLMEGGKVVHLERGVIARSAHTFIFADERLLTRLTEIDKNIASNDSVTLLFTTLEIELWLKAARQVFAEKGLVFPD